MPSSNTLLKIIGHIWMETKPAAFFAGVRCCERVWEQWDQAADAVQKRNELQALAQTDVDELYRAAVALFNELGFSQAEEKGQSLSQYWRLIPTTIRRAMRRVDDPSGTTIPPDFSLHSGAELQSLLPNRLTHCQPGDRPAGLGDWRLVDLLASDPWSETWRAAMPGVVTEERSVLLFFPNAEVRNYLRNEGGGMIERMSQLAQQAGLLELQHTHLTPEVPCLQFEDALGVDLIALAHSQPNAMLDPKTAAVLIGHIANILSPLHRMDPPMVHRLLQPANIVVHTTGDDPAGWQCKLLRWGLGDLWSHFAQTDTTWYYSPQQTAGQPPDPRDDLFALGVLWYQLLTGNWASGRPGGSHWRKQLIERGMETHHVDLLESCFEDDPAFRPATAEALAAAMTQVEAEPSEIPKVKTAAPVGGRTRARRADVWQLFDTLEQSAPELRKTEENSLGMKFALLPQGTYTMGSPDAEHDRRVNEEPLHDVTFAEPFYMCLHLVTQHLYRSVMGDNPSRFQTEAGGGPNHPVENITWEDTDAFCRKLSQRMDEKKARRSYRLPTEAEWEYACRAGTQTPFAFGPSLSSRQANFDAQFPYGKAEPAIPLRRTTPVGTFLANHFGLHDMHGNVWEWCADWLHSDYYSKSPKRNPQGPEEGRFRVVRGGSWRNHAATCRSAYRNGLGPKQRDPTVGFRVVMVVK